MLTGLKRGVEVEEVELLVAGHEGCLEKGERDGAGEDSEGGSSRASPTASPSASPTASPTASQTASLTGSQPHLRPTASPVSTATGAINVVRLGTRGNGRCMEGASMRPEEGGSDDLSSGLLGVPDIH